jgi:hypothetical protein
MKPLSPLAIASTLLVGFSLSNARADSGTSLAGSGTDFFQIRFDEVTTAMISNNGGPFTTLIGTLAPDPAVPAGGGGNVLTFMLPSPVITGDVRIFEPPSLAVLSDVLRFTNAAGSLAGGLNGDRMIVYSDANDVNVFPGLPADVTPFPNLTPRDGGGIFEGPNPLTPNLPYTDDNNGVTYLPGGPNNNIYVFTSDFIPEPASLVMFSLGVLGAGAYAWRKRKRTAA